MLSFISYTLLSVVTYIALDLISTMATFFSFAVTRFLAITARDYSRRMMGIPVPAPINAISSTRYRSTRSATTRLRPPSSGLTGKTALVKIPSRACQTPGLGVSWNAFDNTPAEPVLVRYLARNAGNLDLNCTDPTLGLTESNPELGLGLATINIPVDSGVVLEIASLSPDCSAR